MTGGFLPARQAGKTHDGLIAIADWHATFCALAGVDPAAGEPSAPAPLDGAIPGLEVLIRFQSKIFDLRHSTNCNKGRFFCLQIICDKPPTYEADYFQRPHHLGSNWEGGTRVPTEAPQNVLKLTQARAHRRQQGAEQIKTNVHGVNWEHILP